MALRRRRKLAVPRLWCVPEDLYLAMSFSGMVAYQMEALIAKHSDALIGMSQHRGAC